MGVTASRANTTSAGVMHVVAAGLGVWLFVSTFVWLRSPEQVKSTLACGVLAFASAVATGFQPKARYLSMAVAVWLAVAAFVLPIRDPAARWSDLIVAVLLFATSLDIGGRRAPTPKR